MATSNISESVRERETFRHDPTLLSDIRYNDTGELVSNLELANTIDPILTALAQLGACRIGAHRAFISLFDKSHQYVIAEATQTSSLRRSPDEDGTTFWLRGTAIPRKNGICAQFLNTTKPTGNVCKEELSVNVVPDIRSDPRILENSCVLLESPTRGYAGVPIRSRNGVDFGEYCIVKEEPLQPGEWSDTKSELLKEISQSVLDHLLSKACGVESKRAEQKTRGIGSFVEQRSALISPRESPSRDADMRHKTAAGEKDIRESRKLGSESGGPPSKSNLSADDPGRTAKVRDHSGAFNMPIGRPSGVNPSSTGASLRMSSAATETAPVETVFSRAAVIIRDSIDADGVVFFDASVGSFNCTRNFTGSDESRNTSSGDELWSSDDVEAQSDCTHDDLHVIAFSTSDTTTTDREVYPLDWRKMTSKALSALLRRNPKGTIFDFDENGKLQPSSVPTENIQPMATTNNKSPMLLRRRTQSFIGSLGGEVSKSFPGARSVVFVPVWNQVRTKWCAGCFAYTLDKTRFFNKGDISYLRAFATLAMAEVASLEAQLTSQAQSDVLGSLSHELRSPLHGIILGVEFLTDTPLSVFQGNLLHILETCGRTLSDTIDHLLYYARVNSFIPSGKTRDSRAHGIRKEMNYSLQSGMKSITAPVQVDVLMEEVTESIFAGFNFQRMSIGQLERDHRKAHADIHAIRRSDNLQAVEDLGNLLQEGRDFNISSKHVVIDLAIDHRYSHHYHAISGAIRRIVMNLFGNSLKYTKSGSIRVALSQEPITSKKPRNSSMRWAKIVVSDTGKGISQDFLVNRLFDEFQKEDSIGPGLGLGLHVVKKIVASLKGKVSIESRLGIGTTATVCLPLLPISNMFTLSEDSFAESDDYTELRGQLKGLRVCLVGFDAQLGLPNIKNPGDDYQSIWNICRENLGMEVISKTQAKDTAPDMVICEEAVLFEPLVTRNELGQIPHVVVCVNALSAYRLSMDSKFQDSAAITEFISQPLVSLNPHRREYILTFGSRTGPRKLAKTLVATLQRWARRRESSDSSVHSSKTSPSPTRQVKYGVALDRAHSKETPTTFSTGGPVSFRSLTTDNIQPRRKSSSVSPRSSRLPTPTRALSPPKYGPQFLLVEDNAINMRILCAFMKKLGCSYVTAEDGQIAVDKFREKPGRFHCLLMDINMPRLDGLQATRQIRQIEATNHLRPATIITLSGLASASVQQDALASGVDHFLTKPAKLQEISQTLRSRDLL
ncbi:hypothetical protein F4802DRAFT_612318 [Xylaria palmicola]|nr:hypothetical protein F4802DRAFT_612318 [Xylaria palmicola]